MLSHVEQMKDLIETITSDGCWVWPFRLDDDGYGQCWFNGATRRVHRVAFFFTHGKWPTPIARHTCDNPRCFNPAHIIEGTNKENTWDAIRRKRNVRGERCRLSKLTPEMVLKMRALSVSGVPTSSLAKEFGVSFQSAWAIVTNRKWRHI